MRLELQELFETISGQNVFVIGGGPSLNSIDHSRLDDKFVITINTAFKRFPNATALYWCDEPWASRNEKDLKTHACKLRFTGKHNADNYIIKNIKTVGDATVLKRTGEHGIDTNSDYVRGNNSGSHVINLLANMKVNKIILLGFDMRMVGRDMHWHKEDVHQPAPHIYPNLFIPCMASMAPIVKSMGIDVVNCCVDSALDCFRKQSFEDFMDEHYPKD
jgi:hypothetical protein